MTLSSSKKIGKEIEELKLSHYLTHPVRLKIILTIRRLGKSYIGQIARETGFSEELIGFHVASLAQLGFLHGEYGLNRSCKPPRAVKYFYLTDKVDQTFEALKNRV
ncbi:MAG: hypothetical protein ACE5KU_00665 [Nitrososphaerales archaeon]